MTAIATSSSALLQNALLQNMLPDPLREQARRKVITIILITYVLLIFEGALRKWALEPIHKALFFIRDPFVALSLFLCFRHRLIEMTPLVIIALAMSVCFLFLGGYHIIAFNLNPITVAYGWRNYFYYLFFALVMAAVMRRSDVDRLIRWSLIIAMPMGVLAFIQWRSPPDAWVNYQLGGGDAFLVTAGVVRTTGTFTFTAGFVCFVGATLACLAAAAFTRGCPKWLVALGAAGAATCLATSGARMTFMHAAVTGLLAFACETVRPLASQRIAVHAGVVCMTVGLIGGLMVFYPEALDQMAERSHIASQQEDSGKRFLWSFLAGFTVGEESGLFGLGLGAGTGGGSMAATGQQVFTMAEDEFPRVVLETGLIFGLGFMGLRLVLSGWMLWQSIRCIRARQDAVPLLLCSFCIPLLLIGQMTMQGTVNGYGFIFTGLTLAAINTSAETELS